MTETSADADDIPAEETVRTEIVGDPAAGERVFAQCAVCHAVEPDRNGLGPSLHGVVGRTAAAVDGFNYSPAMQESDIVWSAEALDEYIENPRAAIPGNRMAFAGVRDEQARADVLAYLETLR